MDVLRPYEEKHVFSEQSVDSIEIMPRRAFGDEENLGEVKMGVGLGDKGKANMPAKVEPGGGIDDLFGFQD